MFLIQWHFILTVKVKLEVSIYQGFFSYDKSEPQFAASHSSLNMGLLFLEGTTVFHDTVLKKV